MSVGIVIGTFGSQEWKYRGDELASKIEREQEVSVLSVHGDTLATARNIGAKALKADWIVFLDADDDLAPGYVRHMLLSVNSTDWDIVQPATIGLYPDGTMDTEATLIPKKDLISSNYIVIGAMCSYEKFDKVGGFRELEALEDWDLWRRMYIAGAKIGCCKSAVYIVGVNPSSRNSDSQVHNRVYRQIRNGQ